MFDQERQFIEARIGEYCSANNLPTPEALVWNPIPFSGEWGISTSFFQLAAQEGRLRKERGEAGVNVPQRAQELAAGVAELIGVPAGFTHVEAVRGYLNMYFSTGEYAHRVIKEVLERGPDFGRGAPQPERVMVEYANTNTHHSFHIGHYRNAILGEVVARLAEFAGRILPGGYWLECDHSDLDLPKILPRQGTRRCS